MSATHIRLLFADGHDMIVLADTQVRIRSLSANGVELWPAQKLADGLFPGGFSPSEFAYVDVSGREHPFHGAHITRGTVAAAPPPAEAQADVPAEAPAVDPSAVEPSDEVAPPAPAPAQKRAKPRKTA